MKPVLSKIRETDKAKRAILQQMVVSIDNSKFLYLHILLLSLVLISGCGKQGAQQNGAPALKPDFIGTQSDEHKVYSALLKNFEKEDSEGGLRRFIVRDLTQSLPNACIPYEVFGRDNQVFIKGWQQSIDDLMRREKKPIRLSTLFNLENSYTFIADNEFNAFTDTANKDGFLTFRKKYPDTRCIITFSIIGFDDNKLKAIVYSESWCGPLSGAGDYYALTQTNGFWRVDHKLSCWVS